MSTRMSNRSFVALATIGLIMLACGAASQPLPIYYKSSGGFPIYSSLSRDKIAIVKPLGNAEEVVRLNEAREPVECRIQRLSVLSGMPGAPEILECVTELGRFETGKLPMGANYLITYKHPENGMVYSNEYTRLRLSSNEVAGRIAVRTKASKLANGGTLPEIAFGSQVEAFSEYDFWTMMQMFPKIGRASVTACWEMGGIVEN